MDDAYQGLLGLDRLPRTIKTCIWTTCFALASLFTVYGFFRAVTAVGFLFNLVWLSIIGPTCIAVAVSRLAGVKWRIALLHLILVPTVMAVIYLIILYAGLVVASA